MGVGKGVQFVNMPDAVIFFVWFRRLHLILLNFSFKPLKIGKNRHFAFGTQTCIEKFLAFAPNNYYANRRRPYPACSSISTTADCATWSYYYACTRLELWSASPETVVLPPGNHHALIVFIADYVKRATPQK